MSQVLLDASRVMMWVVGALFTVLLAVGGFQYKALESEVRRVAQLQSQRGERITVVEGQLRHLEFIVQQQATELRTLRTVIDLRNIPASEKYPEFQ